MEPIDTVIEQMEKKIQLFIVGYGREEVLLNCPENLLEPVQNYFRSKGYSICKEIGAILDYDGWETQETFIQYYVSTLPEKEIGGDLSLWQTNSFILMILEGRVDFFALVNAVMAGGAIIQAVLAVVTHRLVQ